MVTETKSLQEENLIQRANIRTMRKDLKQLRESDVLRESEKIIKLKIPSSKPSQASIAIKPEEIKIEQVPPSKVAPSLLTENIIKKPDIYNIDTVSEDDEKKLFNTPFIKRSVDIKEPQIKQSSEVLIEKSQKEENIIAENKKYATEEEKQKIFLLESQKSDLERNIKLPDKSHVSNLEFEKNEILEEQKDWQKKLDILINQEQEIEAELKNTEAKENQISVPSERQSLEKTRWQLEDQRQKIEKKRWFLEQNIYTLENKIKKLNENYQSFSLEGNELKSQITKIDNTLKDIYLNILEREKSKNQKSAHHESHETESKEKKVIHHHTHKTNHPEIKEKEHLKNISHITKPAFDKSSGEAIEKLEHPAKEEKEQKITFMEDVEKWAVSHNKSQE